MTWFRIDDSFYDHPKVFDAPDCAVALWTRAGAWAARNLTDGFVPSGMPARLCDDPERAVKELIDRGLWKRAKGGYRFHDWIAYQPTREEATAGKEKMSAAGALGNHRRWHVAAGKVDPGCRYCASDRVSGGDRPDGTRSGRPGSGSDLRPQNSRQTDRVSASGRPVDNPVPGHNNAANQQGKASGGDRVPDARPESPASPPVPARPDPNKGGSSSYVAHGGAREEPPPSRCPEHTDTPATGPCGPCGDARRARAQHDRDQAAAEARRIAEAPRCRTHRGQLADSCGPCRSERLAREDA